MLRWSLPLCLICPVLSDGPSRFADSSIELLCDDCGCFHMNFSVAAGPESCAESCELETNFFHFGESSSQCACCVEPPASVSTGSLVGTNIYQWKGVLQGYSTLCGQCKCSSDWLGYHSFVDCADTCSRQGFTRFQHANGRKPNGERGDFNCACCHTDSAPSGDPEWGVNVYNFGAADLEERFSNASISVICSDCGCPVNETSRSPFGQEVETCAEICELKTSFFQHRGAASSPCLCCTSPTLNTNQSHLLGQNVYQWKGVLQGYSNICELCRCSNDWLGYHTFADCADTCSRQGFSHFQHANGRKPNGETGDYNCACCNTDSYASDPTWGVNVYAFQSAVPAAVSASSRARLVPSAALALCLFAWELSAIAVTPSRPDNSGMFMA